MEIYPEDLGPRHCRQVLEHRLLYVSKAGAEWASSLKVSPSGRVKATPKPRPTSVWIWQYVVCIAAAWLMEMLFHFSIWVTLFCCTTVAILWRQVQGGQDPRMPSERSTQRVSTEPQTSTYTRLTELEITLLQNTLLQKGADDPLLGMYLDLVWAAMNTAPLAASQGDTERSAREALRALGGAIESLPPQTVDGLPDSHAKLQGIADRLASEATGESDPVVAASLGRRVEALRGQAETVARVRVLLRRNLALREELADQVGALRTSLTAAALGGDDSGPELAGLAARIRRVASEANAVTAARVEVDALLSQTSAHAGVPAVQEEVRQQRVGLNGDML